MTNVVPPPGAAAFTKALNKQMIGRAQQDVADAVTALSGEQTGQAAVSNWCRGMNPPSPPRVFALERVFELAPGTLSRLLGYLPVEAVPAVSVPDALRSDPHLTENQREMLAEAYRVARGQG